jgi:hypothetical protein
VPRRTFKNTHTHTMRKTKLDARVGNKTPFSKQRERKDNLFLRSNFCVLKLKIFSFIMYKSYVMISKYYFV